MEISFNTYRRTEPRPFHFDTEGQAVLFHYTGFSGVTGIIETKELWATNLHCLNDEQEFQNATQLIKSNLQQRKQKENQEYRKLAEDVINRVERISDINIHIISFSEEYDLLSQWRAYGRNGGLSLGFSYKQLRELAKANKFYLGKCIYDQNKKKSVLNSLIERHLRGAVMGVRARKQATERFIAEFVQWAPFFKHEAFSEEKEWRLVSRPILSNHANVAVRATATTMVPYYRFELDRLGTDNKGRAMLGFRYFVVGPQNNPQIVEKSLSYLLSRNNLQWRQVIRSSIPYRII